MVRMVLVSLALLLGACGSGAPDLGSGPPPGTGAPQPPSPEPFDVTWSPEALTLTNRAQGKATYELKWNSYQGALVHLVEAATQHPNFKTVWQPENKTVLIDANGAPPGEYLINVTVLNEARTEKKTRTLKVTVTLDPRVPLLGSIAVQTLQPGQQVRVPLEVQPPANGTPLQGLQVTSAAPEVVTATLSGSTLVLQAAADALPQGSLPVTVSVTAGAETVSVRIPVQIGTLISREYQRYNALRAQANLAPSTFDAEASMNCWLHGRYGVINGLLEHNQNPALPFASPEGQACARSSNLTANSLSRTHLDSRTPATDTLFTAPFHALGMLRPETTSVGIGTFATVPAGGTVQLGSGVSSLGRGGPAQTAPVLFPGRDATTDLVAYAGGEWPNPLTSCPGIRAELAGLPLIVATLHRDGTTASEAVLTVDGQSVPVCAYGSTQYVNTTDSAGNYEGGDRPAQDVGRALLHGSGSVFLIPQARLQAGKTYQAAVKVNGEPVSWTFHVAGTLRPTSVPEGPQVR